MLLDQPLHWALCQHRAWPPAGQNKYVWSKPGQGTPAHCVTSLALSKLVIAYEFSTPPCPWLLYSSWLLRKQMRESIQVQPVSLSMHARTHISFSQARTQANTQNI